MTTVTSTVTSTNGIHAAQSQYLTYTTTLTSTAAARTVGVTASGAAAPNPIPQIGGVAAAILGLAALL